MRSLCIPAKYAAYLAAVLDRAAAEIARDILWRDDDDAEIRNWAPVPDAQFDADATGEIVIEIRTELTLHAGGGVVSSRAPDTSVGPHEAPSRMQAVI